MRYIDHGIAEQPNGEGTDIMGDGDKIATLLFSDVQKLLTITETLGAQGTVSLLNSSTLISMRVTISEQGGMVDQFIGDAIMAGLEFPLPTMMMKTEGFVLE